MEVILDEYDGYGFRIFPVRPRSKKPIREGWQVGATDKGALLYHTFGALGNASVGMVMGDEIVPGRFLFAVDIDPRNGGDPRRLTAALGLSRPPHTAKAWTGGGGEHWLFTAPFPVRRRDLNGLPGIDIKGQGTLIVVEPSLHPGTGKPYLWLYPPRFGVSDAPDALLNLIGPPSSRARPETTPAPCLVSADVSELALYAVDRWPIKAPGQRHELMLSAVGSLRRQGYSAELVTAAMRVWLIHHQAIGVTKTSRPEADADLARCVADTFDNPAFAPAVTDGVDFVACCRAVTLDPGLIHAIRSGRLGEGPTPVSPSPRPAEAAGGEILISRTAVKEFECDRFPSDRECAFIEAVCVIATAARRLRAGDWDERFLMTGQQIMGVAGERHPGIDWDEKQVQVRREKGKWLSSPADGKTAGRFELAREIAKGKRRPGAAKGIASRYVATGLLSLVAELKPGAESVGAA